MKGHPKSYRSVTPRWNRCHKSAGRGQLACCDLACQFGKFLQNSTAAWPQACREHVPAPGQDGNIRPCHALCPSTYRHLAAWHHRPHVAGLCSLTIPGTWKHPCSPDMSFIDHLWDVVDCCICRCVPVLGNILELLSALVEDWNISPASINSLIHLCEGCALHCEM